MAKTDGVRTQCDKVTPGKTSFSTDGEVKEHVAIRKKKKNKKSLPSTATWFVGFIHDVKKFVLKRCTLFRLICGDSYVERVEGLAIPDPSQKSSKSPKKGKAPQTLG